MTGNGQSGETPKKPPRRRWPLRAVALCLALIAVILAGTLFALQSGPLTLPRAAVDVLERRMSHAIAPARMRMGGASLALSGSEGLRVELRDVVIRDGGGAVLGQVTRASADLSARALLAGRVLPRRFGVDGAQITMRRDSAGAFTLDVGGSGSGPRSVAEALAALRASFGQSGLRDVTGITGTDLTIALEDARSGRVWQATGGRFTLRNAGDRVELDVFSEVFNGTETLARLQSSLSVPMEQAPAALSVTVSDAAARDLALQAPVLTYLSVVDALVSGAIRAEIAPDGGLAGFAATLEIGAGELAPGGDVPPVRFNQARAYMTFDPADARISFTELRLESDVLRVAGEGHAYLRDLRDGWPQTLLAQVRVSDLSLAPDDMFGDPVTFDAGRADFRLRLNPFQVDLGQLVLGDGADALRAHGSIRAEPGGWRIATDLAADRIAPDRVLALWPVDAAPGTRRWLKANLRGGVLGDVALALRMTPGQPQPGLGASFSFKDASVRFMPHMPPITGGRGHGALTGDRFALSLAAGRLTQPGHAPLDVGGSRFVVGDVFHARPVGDIAISARGDVTSVLAVLENRPLQVLSRIGRPEDFVQAGAAVFANLSVPLLDEVKVEDVRFDVVARLDDLRSTQVAAGRVVTADSLNLTVNPDVLEITGRVGLDDIPADIRLVQPLGPDAPTELRAALDVDQALLAALGVPLPDGTVSGTSRAEVVLDLLEDGPPAFRVAADLERLALTLPALGWSKPAGAPGRLDLVGRLGRPVAIDRVALTGPGLSAEGRVLLGEEGGFQSAEFDLVRLGDWLEAPITIRPGAAPGDPPRLSIGGGRIDLRRRPDGGGAARSGPATPMDVRLDRLVVNDAISLTEVRADLRAGQGLQGRFTARMNGGAEIRGDLIPQTDGTAFRIAGDNAGAVMRDAGFFRSLDDGSFVLVMVPRPGGALDGQLRIENARLGDQPVLADLLDAVSIVGIIDQLRGPGILFDTIDARFRLQGDRLTLEQSSAVGASLGVSLDGEYDTRTKELNMGGVISPVYVLNSIGQIFTRRGEGLFGFTFRLTGQADNPRMAVNPLSILTPGMFREIFRRPPPERQ